MSQRYERVSANDDEDRSQSPTISPPSYRSRPSSLRSGGHDPERQNLVSDADRELQDTFDSPSGDESDDDHEDLDDRQRVMSGRPRTDDAHDVPTSPDGRPTVERRVTQLPVFAPASNIIYGGGNGGHDGVFANLSAKPERGEDLEEKPPTYEQAAADATPPYWETTILTPGGSASDDVFIDGLPVGSFFSFVWNGMISMSFSIVGFLLTYLLHTTHAAKNGSKAGLGITLIQYGFSMKRDFSGGSRGGDVSPGDGQAPGAGEGFVPPPGDPNSYDFDPNTAATSGAFVADMGTAAAGSAASAMRATDWFAYALMLIGWFILIRSISEYFKARRHEQLVLQSPSRGLNVPVVAEGESTEHAV